jgi:hypothetical protein
MRVVKFISVAVALAILLTLAIVQQAATAQSTPTVKHVPIMNAPVNSGKDIFNISNDVGAVKILGALFL